jgi:hypothetical protein
VWPPKFAVDFQMRIVARLLHLKRSENGRFDLVGSGSDLRQRAQTCARRRPDACGQAADIGSAAVGREEPITGLGYL